MFNNIQIKFVLKRVNTCRPAQMQTACFLTFSQTRIHTYEYIHAHTYVLLLRNAYFKSFFLSFYRFIFSSFPSFSLLSSFSSFLLFDSFRIPAPIPLFRGIFFLPSFLPSKLSTSINAGVGDKRLQKNDVYRTMGFHIE